MKKSILMILDNGFKPDLRVQKEINTLTKMGFSIDLFCWDQEGDLPEVENKKNFNIYRIKLVVKKQQGIKKIIDLVKFYKLTFFKIKECKGRNSYIYVHDFLLLPFGVFLKMYVKLPLIYDAHEIYHLMEWEKYNSIIRYLIFRTELWLSRYVDSFIVVNNKRKEFYLKYIKKQISIIGNWYDPYEGDVVELRKVYNLSKEDIIVSYFGVINFNERPIDAFIKEIMKIPRVHFFIAGVGSDEKKIIEMEKKYVRLHYLGWQDNIRKYFKDVNFLIYYMNDKRKYFEYTAPNSLYLAISHSIPIITNIPGEAEDLIRNKNVGYFIDNPQNLESKILFDHNSQDYAKKIESINKIKDQFKWSECENIYKRIFDNLDLKSVTKTL